MARRSQTLTTGILLLGLLAMPVTTLGSEPRVAAAGQAVDRAPARSTAGPLRVIVTTRPDARALLRIEARLLQLMQAAGIPGRPRVNPALYTIAAQVNRDGIGQLDGDPDVMQILTDAVLGY